MKKMVLTKQERLSTAYADLTKVNAALDQLMQGKLIQRMEFKTAEVTKVFDYNKVTITELKSIRKELLELIDSLEGASAVVYRTGASVPLVVNRSF
jgi:predicted transcriptional regulator